MKRINIKRKSRKLYFSCSSIILRMLSAEEIVESREKPLPELPTFGVKDFEPNGFVEESCQIEHSLNEIRSIVSFKKVKPLKTLSQAIWRPELNLAEVTQQTGSHWTYMGHKVGQKLYIYPEEALFLLETGAMEIIYSGVSISVQRAYFVLFEKDNNFSVAKYRVYSLLKNHGYIVLRHSPLNTVTKYEKKIELHKTGIKVKKCKPIINAGKRQVELEGQSSKTKKKLKISKTLTCPAASNNCDNDGTEMQVIPSSVEDKEVVLTFDYDIYTDMFEKHSFKKSNLQLPSYRVIIHRSEDFMPAVNMLSKLSLKYDDEIQVIHAIVFCDYIAFYKINSMTSPNLND